MGAEALLALADLAREQKDREAEREALLAGSGRRTRCSPLAQQAEQRLEGRSLPVEATVARAEQLIELHRNQQGIDVLEPLLPSCKLPDPLACRAHFAYGKG